MISESLSLARRCLSEVFLLRLGGIMRKMRFDFNMRIFRNDSRGVLGDCCFCTIRFTKYMKKEQKMSGFSCEK